MNLLLRYIVVTLMVPIAMLGQGNCYKDLLGEMTADIDLAHYITESPEIRIDAYNALHLHPSFRNDLNILVKVEGLSQQGIVSFDDINNILRVNQSLGGRAEAVGELLDDIGYFSGYEGRDGYDRLLRQLQNKHFRAAEADGANFVLRAVNLLGVDDLPIGKTSFEKTKCFPGVNGPATRRYDAIVDDNGVKTFYEFKSWASVPPPNFADQFLKDLANPELRDLDHLKWVFDAAKNPENFEAKMKEAIRNLPIDQLDALSAKFGLPSDRGDLLLMELITHFNSIFSLMG